MCTAQTQEPQDLFSHGWSISSVYHNHETWDHVKEGSIILIGVDYEGKIKTPSPAQTFQNIRAIDNHYFLFLLYFFSSGNVNTFYLEKNIH